MAEAPKEKMTASKVIAFIGMLFTLSLGIAYFYGVTIATGLYVLWGIICLVIAFLIFVSLGLISLGKFKIPYTWWMLLIYGAVLVLIVYVSTLFIANIGGIYGYFPNVYFPAVLLLMAFIIELVTAKKAYKVSKMVALAGCAFAAYECVLLILTSFPLFVVNAVFGLALIVIFILVIFDLVNFKIFDYSWWFVLLVGFVIFTWISWFTLGALVAGFGGILILIAFLLIVMDY
ncbi:MAG: hypothetical protein ACFE8V_08475 [Promethearchaeota archaeon]